jgi:hypothetical protein
MAGGVGVGVEEEAMGGCWRLERNAELDVIAECGKKYWVGVVGCS